jgi:hypothetical protein
MTVDADEMLEALKRLIGKTVTAVEHFGSDMNEGFIISFSDGTFLTQRVRLKIRNNK